MIFLMIINGVLYMKLIRIEGLAKTLNEHAQNGPLINKYGD
jgi:hypothetical protein